MSIDAYNDEDPHAIATRPSGSLNPFESARPKSAAIAASTAQREVSEVQGALVIAQQYPRRPVVAMDRILNAFSRPRLAEQAQYQYARGGTDIAGQASALRKRLRRTGEISSSDGAR